MQLLKRVGQRFQIEGQKAERRGLSLNLVFSRSGLVDRARAEAESDGIINNDDLDIFDSDDLVQISA